PGDAGASLSSEMLVALMLAGALMVLLVVVLRRMMVRPATATVRLPRWLGGARSEPGEHRGAAAGRAVAALRAAVAAAGGSVAAQNAAVAAVDRRSSPGDRAAAFGDRTVARDAAAAADAGVLLLERGDIAGALEAFRWADAQGDAAGASNL